MFKIGDKVKVKYPGLNRRFSDYATVTYVYENIVDTIVCKIKFSDNYTDEFSSYWLELAVDISEEMKEIAELWQSKN
jgi:hypothetical protein